MISSELQRTLVKSPPELWAEISDPAALGRHLGEFGEIRITRLEPEQRVEWQADDACGSVVIKPSGWGTKVMLTVTRELTTGAEPAKDAEAANEADAWTDADTGAGTNAEAAQDAEAGEPAPLEREPLAYELLEPDAGEPEPSDDEQATGFDEAPEPIAAFTPAAAADDGEREAEGETEIAAAAPRRGFFAWLFARRRRAPEPRAFVEQVIELESTQEPDELLDIKPYNALAVWAAQAGADDTQADGLVEDAAAAKIAETPGAPRVDAQAEARAGDERSGGPAPAGVSDELEAAEEIAAEQTTEVLSGVLDRLGAAHHRPFSRA